MADHPSKPTERDPDRLKRIGQRLKIARESLGITQKQLCQTMGIGTSAWNHWEMGRRMPDPLAMAQLANEYDISLDWIYRDVPGDGQFTLDEMKAIGVRLKASRTALGLKLKELSLLLGIEDQVWENWEIGVRSPSPKVMVRFASMKGITLDWVFAGNPSSLPHALAGKILEEEKRALVQSGKTVNVLGDVSESLIPTLPSRIQIG